MATEPTVDDPDAPMQTEFPLTALLGDAMSTRVLNLFIRTNGRCALSLADVCKRVNASTDDDVREVLGILDRLRRIEAIREPSIGRFVYCPGHDAIKHLADAERHMVAKMYPDSWYASVVTAEE